jgi:Flp pilus assembly protein TadB
MQLAGDGERERAAASLREHFLLGRLTVEELSERTGLALRARSRDELRRALDGLPQFNGRRVAQTATRVAALVVFTGAWLMFSFALLVVLGLTMLIHGASGTALVGFLLVWLVPTYLLSRLWRRKRTHGVSEPNL